MIDALIRVAAAATLLSIAACEGGEGTDSAVDASTPSEVATEVSVTPAPTPAATTPTPAPTAGEDEAPPVPVITRLPDPSSIADTPRGLRNGAFAPELAHLDMRSGEAFSLSDITGPTADEPATAVIVGFTASWCGPCKQSYPYLQKMQEENEGLRVVLVTTDATVDAKAKHVEVLAGTTLKAPLLDPSPDSLRAWMGQKRNVPHFYIINAAGEILVQDRGFGDKVRRVMPGQVRYALNHPEYVRRK